MFLSGPRPNLISGSAEGRLVRANQESEPLGGESGGRASTAGGCGAGGGQPRARKC